MILDPNLISQSTPRTLGGIMNPEDSRKLGITIGIVRDTDDPEQLGRLRVFCPTVDNEHTAIDDLPWCLYGSPFGGSISDLAVGPDKQIVQGTLSYGFFAVPKVGANVLVMFLDGDPNTRVYFGSIFGLGGLGRSLPSGHNYDSAGKFGKFTEEERGNILVSEHAKESGLMLGDWYQNRGGFERAVGISKIKRTKIGNGKDGYAPNPNNPNKLDPQSYVWTTPGQHFLLMSDAADSSRVRLKSALGNQIILDDTNERIYIATQTGKNFIEMDSCGLIHIYSDDAISFHTKTDFNITADNSINMISPSINIKGTKNVSIDGTCCLNLKSSSGDVNIESGKTTHIKAGQHINQQAAATLSLIASVGNFSISGTGVNITGYDDIRFSARNFQTNGDMKIRGGLKVADNIVGNIGGSAISPNPPGSPRSADSAPSPAQPSITPQHEPWPRPAGKGPRNKFWRP